MKIETEFNEIAKEHKHVPKKSRSKSKSIYLRILSYGPNQDCSRNIGTIKIFKKTEKNPEKNHTFSSKFENVALRVS